MSFVRGHGPGIATQFEGSSETDMFALTVADQVRLDSQHVEQNYTVHARAAERVARAVFVSRIVIAALLTTATLVSVAAVLAPARAYQIASVVTTSMALLVFGVYAALGLEARVCAHRALAHRLWLAAERYRSLLAEVHEGIIDNVALLERRDKLITQVHTIYELGLAADQAGHESIRLRMLPDQRKEHPAA